MKDPLGTRSAWRPASMFSATVEPQRLLGIWAGAARPVGSAERQRLGWIVTLTGAAMMAAGAALMALNGM